MRLVTVSMFIADVMMVTLYSAMRAAKLPVPPPASRPSLKGAERKIGEVWYDSENAGGGMMSKSNEDKTCH